MAEKAFHHALKIDQGTCIGCAHCMKACPTEAIRVQGGKAYLLENRCVDCGECYRVCPVNAISVEHDDFAEIFNFKYRVVLLPGVFLGQFPEKISLEKVKNALNDLGFTHVYEIEKQVEFFKEKFNEVIRHSGQEKPLISSFCPAVVRLIQVEFPALVPRILHWKAPLDVAAFYCKKNLLEAGIEEKDIGIFYVTPCAAKIAAVKSPVGEEKSLIKGVINMDFLYNKVLKNIYGHAGTDETGETLEGYFNQDILWSLTGGEARHMKGKSLSIDAMHNVIEFLERVEDDEISGVDFLELRACDQGCAGGILASENRFLTVDKLNKLASANNDAFRSTSAYKEFWEYLQKHMRLDKIKPRSILKLDEDMQKAMDKMARVRKLMCFLPGIDCGVCGAPSCNALAEDVVKGHAHISDCFFIQRGMEQNNKLGQQTALNIMEKIWGKGRFEKDCYKKGAENEGI